MRWIQRKAPALAGAVVMLLCCAANAGAVSGLTISATGEFTSAGSIIVTERGETSCNITLRGSFSRSLVAAVAGTQIGSVTGVTIARCEPFALVPLELPWPIRFRQLNEEEASFVPAEAVEVMSTSVAGRFADSICLMSGTFELLPATVPTGTVEARLAGFIGYGFMPMTCGGMGVGTAHIELTTGTPSVAQTFTFLRGGSEVINGPSPNPVDFGTVRTSELTQRTVTIGSLRGGRIEEVTVATGRWFSITDPNECRGRTLGVHGTCRLNVIVSAPAEAGRVMSDTLRVRLGGRSYEAALRATT